MNEWVDSQLVYPDLTIKDKREKKKNRISATNRTDQTASRVNNFPPFMNNSFCKSVPSLPELSECRPNAKLGNISPIQRRVYGPESNTFRYKRRLAMLSIHDRRSSELQPIRKSRRIRPPFHSGMYVSVQKNEWMLPSSALMPSENFNIYQDPG